MPVLVSFSTIPEMFRSIIAKFRDSGRPVMLYKQDGQYVGISYGDLATRVEHFAGGLAALGFKRGDRISIISENRPEWAVADLAAVYLGGVGVPIYPTMTARQNEYIFNDAGVGFVVVSNRFQLNKVLKVLPEVKTLRKVIVMNEKDCPTDNYAVSFNRVCQMGREFLDENPGYIDDSLRLVKPEDLLTLIYTSGTTGNPKGVMLTHSNLVSNMVSAADVIPLGPEETMLSFLPLSHSFERMAGYYTALACGVTIAYAESIEKVGDNMLEVCPTIVTTVPRLFERIHGRIMKKVDSGKPIQKKIFAWACRVGREYVLARKRGRIPTLLGVKHAAAEKLVFEKLRARTGGRMKFFISGGAALPRELGEFFEAAGLHIIEGYGLTETSPVISVNRVHNYKFGSVGQPIPGVEVRIAEDGEILSRGPNTMKGYWNNKAATDEMIDNDGWLHTGDIGVIDAEGFIHITDRKKHLFVSSGGKNIAPQPIENMFLSNKYVEQFVLIGDRRMFLTALIVPDFEALKEYADGNGIAYEGNADLVTHPEIQSLIDKQIAAIQKDLASFERVRKFTLLEQPFSIDEGELTPTQKVKRKFVEQKYSALIERMYEGLN
jgi:long-chain acyl-CoA synthetase